MIFCRRWLLILSVLILGGGPVFAASKEDRAFAAASAAFQDGIYERAETEFARFVQQYPKSSRVADAVLLQAQAQFKQGKNTAAIALLSTPPSNPGRLADRYAYWLGEAQRVKLATELARKATGRTLYILDEPTTGLHFHDVAKLLEVLFKLRDAGNTLVIIEHNLDVIKTADWLIDLGPEGGSGGGKIVAEGPPEKIVECEASYTGRYLREVLNTAPAPVSAA